MDLLSYRQMAAAGATLGRDRPPRRLRLAHRPQVPLGRAAAAAALQAAAAEAEADRPVRRARSTRALRASKAQIRATTIHERLVADHGYPGSYQRVKEYVRARRPEIAAELGLRTRRRDAPPLRGRARRPGPGRLGPRAEPPRRQPRLQLPHGAQLLARPLLPLHRPPGPRHLLGLPRGRLRPLRRRARPRSSTTAPRRW